VVPDAPDDLAIRVVRGNPSEEELQAVRLALAQATRAPVMAVRGGWFDPDPALRRAAAPRP
jgi:hypothetical protein